MEVGDDLASLLGYDIHGDPRPWGHITCDGTVANIESMWAARNLKFQPLTFQEALRNQPSLVSAKNMTVPVYDRDARKKVDRVVCFCFGSYDYLLLFQ